MRVRHRFSIALVIVGMIMGAAHASLATANDGTPDAVRAAADSRAKAKAISDLRVAAVRLHRAADRVVNSPDLIGGLAWLQVRGEMYGAIEKARGLGLNSAAEHYEAVLKRETARVEFARFVRRAEKYGKEVAQRAHESQPQLTPAQLGQIASNASAWYGNSTVQKNLLASAKHIRGNIYEVTVKSGQDLDVAAYKIYRGLSVGARKTNTGYTGREGLHALPGKQGGMNGGFIGFRRAAETSGKKSPAIDLKTPELGSVRVHFVK